MSVLAIIPARGGSKGIPRKNIKKLNGKPLIGWTIGAAKEAHCIDRIVVSTEDDEIASVAKGLGADVPFLRPAELAKDDTPGIDPVLHAIDQMPKYDWVLLLQPTSPLRSAADIDAIWALCQQKSASSAVSISEVSKHPFWMYQRDDFFRISPVIQNRPDVTRRQDLPPAYALNGALYLVKTTWLLEYKSLIGPETVGYAMPRERAADIDHPMDWLWVEFLMKREQISSEIDISMV